MAFLREVPEGTYDAIIVDSSDPVGKSSALPWVANDTNVWVSSVAYFLSSSLVIYNVCHGSRLIDIMLL